MKPLLPLLATSAGGLLAVAVYTIVFGEKKAKAASTAPEAPKPATAAPSAQKTAPGPAQAAPGSMDASLAKLREAAKAPDPAPAAPKAAPSPPKPIEWAKRSAEDRKAAQKKIDDAREARKADLYDAPVDPLAAPSAPDLTKARPDQLTTGNKGPAPLDSAASGEGKWKRTGPDGALKYSLDD